MNWTDKYMAIPFRDGGRGWDGADCMGLYALILATEAGHRLPDWGVSYDRDPAAVTAHVVADLASGRWRRVDGAPQRFDGVLMAAPVRTAAGMGRADLHIGCVTAPGPSGAGGWMIHTEQPAGVRLVRIADPSVAARIRGFYRPAGLGGAAAAATVCPRPLAGAAA